MTKSPRENKDFNGNVTNPEHNNFYLVPICANILLITIDILLFAEKKDFNDDDGFSIEL